MFSYSFKLKRPGFKLGQDSADDNPDFLIGSIFFPLHDRMMLFFLLKPHKLKTAFMKTWFYQKS